MSGKDVQKSAEVTPQEVEDNFNLLLTGDYNSKSLIAGFQDLIQVQPEAQKPEVFRMLADYADKAAKKAHEANEIATVHYFEGSRDSFNSTANVLEKPAAPPKPADQLQMTDPKK